MNQIGKIIKYFRQINNMPREQLSRGICTAKYLYLIEKGDRTPSNAILAKLGERMNMSFFDYYNYLECEDPIEVKKIMTEFMRYRRNFDFEKLTHYQDVADAVPDFKKIPWIFEIDFNQSMLKLILDRKPKEAARDILNTISKMPPEYQYGVHHLRQLILLSFCYLESDKIKTATFTIEQVRENVECKADFFEFQQIYFIGAYIHIIIKLRNGDPAAALEIVDKVLLRQKEMHYYDFHHFSLLLKGYALLKLGKFEDARSPVSKGLLSLLVFDKCRDITYLNHIGIMPDILQSGLVDEKISEEIKNKYQI